MLHRLNRISLFILMLFCSLSVFAAKETPVPDVLKDWVPWVLAGNEKVMCPFHYRDDEYQCAWPETLFINANDRGGEFSQKWKIYEKSWIALAGNSKHWPQDVMIDGKPAVVVERSGAPYLQLGKGEYQLTGHFIWQRLPEFIDLPKNSGLVEVKIKGQQVAFPRLMQSGKLWLNENTTSLQAIEDHLYVDIFRKIIDEVPLKMVTRLALNVGGKAREIVLGPLYSSDFLPLLVKGPLPMRLEENGELRVQVRPGQWVLEITARHQSLVDHLSLLESNLPDNEVWVFEAAPDLRLVEIAGVSSVDPRQTKLPTQWQGLPSYRVSKKDQMRIVTIRRGDPDPSANELTLKRDIWLDFDGGGFTFQDEVKGQMRQGWRLNMSPEMTLGRAEVYGENQLITHLNGEPSPGIEVRQGTLSIKADGRYEGDIANIPAVGWADNFTQVQSTLHLPPGWRLFMSQGADSVGGASWVEGWTLLDIFLVLIASLAVFHLFGAIWGMIALACLVLSWHEVDAPQYIWLFMIAVMALMRVTPEGKLRSFVMSLRYLSLVLFAVVAIPYLIDTVRTAVYPQLERVIIMEDWDAYQSGEQTLASNADVYTPTRALEKIANLDELDKSTALNRMATSSMSAYHGLIDSNAKIQTGPGLPSWQWSTVPIRWNGPVQAEQRLTLMLIDPATNQYLKVLCVILFLLLTLRFLGVSFKNKRAVMNVGKLSFLSLFLMSALWLSPNQVIASDIPSPELLEELQTRLLSPAKCLPHCAQVSRMKLEVKPQSIQMLLEVHASESVSIPIPGHVDGWVPNVILLDGEITQASRGKDNALWVNVSKGKHQIKLTGLIRPVRAVQLPMTLTPHHIDVVSEGWIVKGVHSDGMIEKVIQLEREMGDVVKIDELEQTTLPSFLKVIRTLRLGLEWRIETHVMRVSPTGQAITVELPLLEGETVTTEGVRVKAGVATVQLKPDQSIVSWTSMLKTNNKIELKAKDTLDWVELWQLDVSPIWHVVPEGIPQIHHQSQQGVLFPQWRPWPGETLSLNVTKPAGVAGKTLTVDYSKITITPGLRAMDVTWDMRLRSSQAVQHVVRLPDDAVLGLVTINDESQPVRQEEGGIVRLPISPGEQDIRLSWQSAGGIENVLITPTVNLGIDSVNANIEIKVPRDRWVLFTTGPLLGPAVLFWGVLIVVVIFAFGLGRTRTTPLKTHQWLLLGVGLSQAMLSVVFLVIAWLFAMGWRKNQGQKVVSVMRFNLTQLALVVLTLSALLGLLGSVANGLLGHPEMQISGNNSGSHYLKWYADQATEVLPEATMVSVPMWVYRGLMLAWSLWLAFALLGWLKWTWHSFSAGDIWRSAPRKKKSTKEIKLKSSLFHYDQNAANEKTDDMTKDAESTSPTKDEGSDKP